jgi:hypothetical protein
MAFIRKVKRPRLRMLIGSVSKMRMGRKKAFRMPRMAAAKKALKNPLTCMPSIRYEADMMATVKMSHLRKRPLILVLLYPLRTIAGAVSL